VADQYIQYTVYIYMSVYLSIFVIQGDLSTISESVKLIEIYKEAIING